MKNSEIQTAFVISPIGKPDTDDYRRYRLVLDYIVRKALEPDWCVVRADEESAPDSIGSKVIERIVDSECVIAILTDQNPNVFYELAIAHGYRRPVVHMLESGQKMPFDIGDQRAIFYDLTDPASVDEAKQRLSESVEYVIGGEAEPSNPLSQHEAFRTIREGSSADDAGTAVAEVLQDLVLKVDRLSGRMSSLEIATRHDAPRRVGPTSPARELARLDVEEQRLLASDIAPEERVARLAEIERRRHHMIRRLSAQSPSAAPAPEGGAS